MNIFNNADRRRISGNSKISFLAFNSLLAACMIALPALAEPTAGDATTTAKVKTGKCESGQCSKMGSKGRLREGKRFEKNKLGLTNDQLTKMASLKQQFSIKTAEDKAQLISLKQEERTMLFQPTLDKNQIEAVQKKLDVLQAKLADEKLDSRLDMVAILTPDQKEKLERKTLVQQVFKGGFGHERGGRRA